jgi:hypothetical protein
MLLFKITSSSSLNTKNFRISQKAVDNSEYLIVTLFNLNPLLPTGVTRFPDLPATIFKSGRQKGSVLILEAC